MKVDTETLKTRVSFRELVASTHAIDRTSKVTCPHHDDSTPSYHVYEDHGFCFVCQTSDDHIGWLQARDGLTFTEAVTALEALAGVSAAPLTSVQRKIEPKRDKSCDAKPVTGAQRDLQWRRAARLADVPEALWERGFTLADLLKLRVASENGDALLPIFAPDGSLLAIKRRRVVPEPQRYSYVTPGHGAPAWCSPGFIEHDEVLVIEGELNAMACWLARPDLAVMGTAGTNGDLHLTALGGSTIYVYGDGDKVGQEARARWAAQAHRAGATKVYVLEPWEMDACDIAGTVGREALRERIS